MPPKKSHTNPYVPARNTFDSLWSNDPAKAAAQVMVQHLLAAAPELRMAPTATGIAIVVEVPDATWVDPIAVAFVTEFHQPETETGPDEEEFGSKEQLREAWIVCRATGHGQPETTYRANIPLSLASGRNVLGVSPNPRRHLPKELVRCADWNLAVPSMDAAVLADVVEAITGERPKETLSDTLCRLVGPEELRLARRPGEGADACLRRLRRLVEPKVAATGITLDDLHGMDAAVSWGRALAVDLGEFAAGRLPWTAVDKGVLLTGPPGTGKTTFAQALAGTCGVPLIAGSLAQWQAQGHLGDLLKAMRATFDQARRAAPCILFIDEIDSFGDRGSFSFDHRDYSIQVVNGLLEELDGVAGREGVVVVGACNLPDRLDPAITRSGRLDRVVNIPLPDKAALARIFRYWLGPDLADADLAMVATLALGSTGADCERWVRGARRRARTANRDMVVDDLVAEIRGPSPTCPPHLLRRRAVHEAGHAIALAMLRPGALIGATIREAGDTGGGVIAANDEPLALRETLLTRIRILLAGRAAEELLLGAPSTGAGGDKSSDLARATMTAASMVTAFGFDQEQGLLWTGLPSAGSVDVLTPWRPNIERRVSAVLAEAYADNLEMLRTRRNAVEKVADMLVASETVTGADIEAMALPAEPPVDTPPGLTSVPREQPS